MLGYLDEVWWSRFAQPAMHAWAPAGAALRLVSRSPEKEDEQPKALSCYGVLLGSGPEAPPEAPSEMLVRFVKGRPVSHVTTAFLAWVVERLAARGKQVWALIWDNASWHISREVKGWITQHNRRVKREGGVRIITCELPVKSPWLNPIEPTWLHGKRAICEPDGALSVTEVMARVCAHYGCELLEPIEQKTS